MRTIQTLPRRTWLSAAALATIATIATIATLAGTGALAQQPANYPTKPIKVIVPFAPGGATDVLARVLAEKMAAGLGQPLVIDNKPGAAGIIGTMRWPRPHPMATPSCWA